MGLCNCTPEEVFMDGMIDNNDPDAYTKRIKEVIKRAKDGFIAAPLMMASQYRNDERIAEDYHGRELLELIQNADDEMSDTYDKSIYIHLSDKELVVANNGNRFSIEGLESILYSNLSNKEERKNMIGYKGLGFRSILGWAHSIYVKSYEMSLEFSEKSAFRFWKLVQEKQPHEARIVKGKCKGVKCPVPMLSVPEPVEICPRHDEYDTYIVLSLRPRVRDSIIRQMKTFREETLLFLKNVEEITFEAHEFKRVIVKEPKSGHYVHIRTYDREGDEAYSKKWQLIRKKGTCEHFNADEKWVKKKYEIAVAHCPKHMEPRNPLYSFFETNITMPFSMLLHASFDLKSDRNDIVDNEANWIIMHELIKLMLDTAEKRAKNNRNSNYKALEMVLPSKIFDDDMERYHVRKPYIEQICSKKLLPTIYGDYISFDDEPIAYKTQLSMFLPQTIEFKKNLKYRAIDTKWRILEAEKLTCCKCDLKLLIEGINRHASEYSPKSRVKMIKLIWEEYGDQLIQANNANLEKVQLFLNTKGEPLIDKRLIYYQKNRGHQIEPPGFLDTAILNKSMYKQLLKEFDKNEDELNKALEGFRLSEYSFDEILNDCIQYIEKCTDGLKCCTDNIVELIQWLYKIYDMNGLLEKPESIDDIPLFDRHGVMTKVKSLYMGKEYGEALCERLMHGVRDVGFVGESSILGLSDVSKTDAKAFLEWLGVSRLPRVHSRKFTFHRNDNYLSYILNDLNYPFRFKQGGEYESFESLKVDVNCIQCKNIVIVEHLKEILFTSKIEDVVAWLYIHEELAQHLKHINESSMVIADVDLQTKKNARKLSKIKSYVRYVFTHEHWVPTISGSRVIPAECCADRNHRIDIGFLLEKVDIDWNSQVFAELQISQEGVQDILKLIGIPTNFRDIPSEKMYYILLNYPKYDPLCKSAPKLYQLIAQNMNLNEKDRNGVNYQRFLNEGLICSSLKGEANYLPVKTVYYQGNLQLCKAVVDEYPFIKLMSKDIPSSRIESVFGIKPIHNIVIRVFNTSSYHDLNQEFRNDINDLIPLKYCMEMSQDNNYELRNKYQQLSINLCTSINAILSKDGVDIDLEVNDYESLQDTDTGVVYIKIPENKHKTLQELKEEIDFTACVAERITYSHNSMSVADVALLYSINKELWVHALTRIKRFDSEKQLDEKLADAIQLLAYTLKERVAFWETIHTVTGAKVEFPLIKNEDELIKWIVKATGFLDSDIKEHLCKFDFKNYSSIQNITFILELFHNLNIDICHFNKVSPIKINLIEYYVRIIKGSIGRSKTAYKYWLFCKLQNKGHKYQKFYESRLDDFNNYRSLSRIVENSVNFDWKRSLKETYGVGVETLKNQKNVDVDSFYFQNESRLLEDLDVTEEIMEEFLTTELKSLLYFDNNIELLKQQLYDFLQERQNEVNVNTSETKENMSTTNDLRELTLVTHIPINPHKSRVTVHQEVTKPTSSLGEESDKAQIDDREKNFTNYVTEGETQSNNDKISEDYERDSNHNLHPPENSGEGSAKIQGANDKNGHHNKNTPEMKAGNGDHSQSKTPNNDSIIDKRSPNNDKIGEKGERLVYDEFRRRLGENSVSWVSQYAKDRKINPNGSNLYGYDIKFIDNEGVEICVEVKATTSAELRFQMTKNEVEVAERLGQRHLLIVITEINSRNQKGHCFRGLFDYKEGESFEENYSFYQRVRGYDITIGIEAEKTVEYDLDFPFIECNHGS